MAAEHRGDGAGCLLWRRLLHAWHDRQRDPRGVPREHRADDHRRHLLLQHGPAERHHRRHRADLRAPRQGQDADASLGVLPHGCRTHGAGNLLPGRRRAPGAGGHRLCLRITHPPGPDGRLHHQRSPRGRFFPVVRGRGAGARHRTGQRLPHFAGSTVHCQLCRQPHPVGPDRRGAGTPGANCATAAAATTPACLRPAPSVRTASKSLR